MPKLIPTLHERDRIARGLVSRLDDPPKVDEPGVDQQNEVLEMVVPFATQCFTFLLVRVETPPTLELVDFARIAIVQRMLNSLPVSVGLVRRHLYVEAIAASRTLLEGALLLKYFQKKPERAADWFDAPKTFQSLGPLRKEIDEEPRDPMYSWSSELGEHVTASAFHLIAGIDEEKRRVTFSVGGRFDAKLQTQTCSVLLMSVGVASGALTDMFLRDTLRMTPRGQGAFAQLMKAGVLDASRKSAIQFVSQLGDAQPDAGKLLGELDALAKQYAAEAATWEAAGLKIPAPEAEF